MGKRGKEKKRKGKRKRKNKKKIWWLINTRKSERGRGDTDWILSADDGLTDRVGQPTERER